MKRAAAGAVSPVNGDTREIDDEMMVNRNSDL